MVSSGIYKFVFGIVRIGIDQIEMTPCLTKTKPQCTVYNIPIRQTHSVMLKLIFQVQAV